jgi:hypothetical protein
MHQRLVYDLPPVFAAIAENVVRLETMSSNAGGVSGAIKRARDDAPLLQHSGLCLD